MLSLDIKPTDRPKVIWFHLAIAALVLGIYAAFFNSDFSGDALWYALLLENDYGSHLLHPHHLLFHTVSWGWYRLGRFLVSWGPMETIQWLNAIAGTAGVLLVFQIISDRIGSLIVAMLLSLGVAFSYSYWHYSIEHEIYILPLVLILFAFFILSRYALTFVSVAWVAVAVGLATLLHQSHILITVAITIHLLSTAVSARRTYYVLFFLTLSGLLIVIPYLLAAYITGHLIDLSSLFRWITAYAQEGRWGVISWMNVPYATMGFTRALFSGSHLRNSVITGHFSMISGVTLLHMMLSFISFTVILARSRKWWSAKVVKEIDLLRLCTMMGTVYAGFAMYWEPQNREFWVPVVLPVIIIFGLLMQWDRVNRGILLCLVIMLFAVNFADGIYPDSHLQNNESYMLAKKLKEYDVGEEDLVLISKAYPRGNLRLFFGSSVRVHTLTDRMSTFQATEVMIERTIKAKRRVFISEDELKPFIAYTVDRFNSGEISDFYQNLNYDRRLLFGFKANGRERKMYEFVTKEPEVFKDNQ